jgi:chemotaxis protein MotA
MDIATIIGLISGTILIASAVILGGTPIIFINIPSLLIVLGGTIATTFIKFKMSDVINSIKVVMKAFTVKASDPEEMIQEMVGFTRIAKKEGLIALEKEVATDAFAAKALRYLSDGFDEGLIEDMLSKDIRLTFSATPWGKVCSRAWATARRHSV